MQHRPAGSPTLVVMNEADSPVTLYARFEFESDPGNRNLGFVQELGPGQELVYNLPARTRVFACDGKYWDDYRPLERLVGVVGEGESLRLTASEFRP